MGEPGYEQFPSFTGKITAVQMRRQAYQSLWAGAAGFTYGGFRDEEGNGPLFSPYKGWQKLLDWPGATSMTLLIEFSLRHGWPNWTPLSDTIFTDNGGGELQNVGVYSSSTNTMLIYFPDRSEAVIRLTEQFVLSNNVNAQWYNPASGHYSDNLSLPVTDQTIRIIPPQGWADAVLIIHRY